MNAKQSDLNQNDECRGHEPSTRGTSRPRRRAGRTWALVGATAVLTTLLALSPANGGAIGAASPETPPTPSAPEEWLRGAEEEKTKTIGKHLRGLDMTMVEIDHRYGELYWAGQDRNWEYAAYQLDKIRFTLELGIERRPKRAVSAQVFLANGLPPMKQAIEKKDASAFESQFKLLTLACNTCHAMEKVAFMQVHTPEQRRSSIRFKP